MKSIFKSKPKTPSDLVRQMRDLLVSLNLSGTEGKESRRDEKVQQGNVATPKINTPIPRLTVVASGVSNIIPVAVDVAARYGRHNKKSKWDKVDVNQRNFNPSGGQETLFAIGAHSSLISAAKAGSGYTTFAQQRRKEAENRRSSESTMLNAQV